MSIKSEISPINLKEEKKPKNQITVKIDFGADEKTIICNENEKTELILGKFCSENKLQLTSVYFLYYGKIVTDDDYKKPIKEIISKIDQQRKIMDILSYQNDVQDYSEEPYNDDINLMLMLDSKEEIKIKGKKIKKLA